MEWRRIALYVITALLGAILFFLWQKDHSSNVVPPTTTSSPAVNTTVSANYNPQSYLPEATTATESTATTTQKATLTGTGSETSLSGQLVQVKTDVLDVVINTNEGNVISAKLLKYPVSLDQPDDFVQIQNTDPQQFYVAQSGLVTQPNQTQPLKPITYEASQKSYQLTDGQNSLVVSLVGHTADGLEVKKDYVFKRNSYAIAMHYTLTNHAAKAWNGAIYQQITRGGFVVKSSLHGRSYTGFSISSPQTPYEKLSFKKLSQTDLKRDIQGGWLAMQQQYFLSVWIPNQDQINHFYSHTVVPPNNSNYVNNIYTLGYLSPYFAVEPNQSSNYQSTLYVGPQITKNLQPLAKGLERTIDYGYLWFISKFIFWLMEQIHHVVGNWGWSIVIITLLVRLSLYWFAARGFHSMAKMRDVQPRIQALKERFGDDKQGLSKATMELYRKEKINPMGGCLPMVVQIPVFFALYYVLIESVELRQAPFILWVRDLAVHDPYYVLPILMGLSMLLQQKLSPPPADPMQAKMMMLLPVIFTAFFLSFPAGLVLYWLTNNCASVAQQWYIMRTYNPKVEREKARKKKKKK